MRTLNRLFLLLALLTAAPAFGTQTNNVAVQKTDAVTNAVTAPVAFAPGKFILTKGTAPTYVGSSIVPYADSSGRFGYVLSTGISFLLDPTGITASRTVVFPDASGNVVIDSATQTLTNKSIAGSEINSGTVPTAQMPAFSGEVTSSAGGTVTTLSEQAKALTATHNTLSSKSAFAFDGTQNTRLCATIPTAQALGTDSLSVAIGFRCPAFVGAYYHGLWFLGSSNTTAAAANALEARIETSGSLVISLWNSSANGSLDTTVSGFTTAYANTDVHLLVIRNGTALSVYVNGAAVTASAAGSGTSPPSDYSGTVASSYFGIGYVDANAVAIGTINYASVYNLALSAADAKEITERNGAVPERYKYGSEAGIINGATLNGNFETGSLGVWTTSLAGSSTAAIDSTNPHGGTYDAALYYPGGGVACTLYQQAQGSIVTIGRSYYYSFWAKASVAGVTVSAGTGNDHSIGAGTSFTTTTSYAQYSGYVSGDTYAGQWRFFLQLGGTAGTVYIDDVLFKQLGAICHYNAEDGIGLQAADQSTNYCDAVATASTSGTGFTWSIPKTQGIVRFTTNTNGNQQILGQQALPPNARIMSWVINSSGTPTVSLGNASAGTQFANALVLVNGPNEVTPTTRYCSTNNLWVSSNSTATLTHTIRYEVYR